MDGALWKRNFWVEPSGYTDWLVGKLGRGLVSWLTDSGTAVAMIAYVDAWPRAPFGAIILMAMQQSVPPEFYGASADDTSPLRLFADVTLPLTRRVLAISTALVAIFAFTTFD